MDVKSGVVKSSKINIGKACKNLGLKELGFQIRNVVKSGDENTVVHCISKYLKGGCLCALLFFIVGSPISLPVSLEYDLLG